MDDDIDIRILRALRDAIEATLAFGEVRIGPPPEEQGMAASSGPACTIEIPPGSAAPRWGGGDETTMRTTQKVTVTILARGPSDPGTGDELAMSLLGAVKGAVNGKSLDGLNVPDLTYVEKWTPMPRKHPERRIRAVVTLDYTSDWDGEDPS